MTEQKGKDKKIGRKMAWVVSVKLGHTRWSGCCRDMRGGNTRTFVDGLRQGKNEERMKVRSGDDGALIRSA